MSHLTPGSALIRALISCLVKTTGSRRGRLARTTSSNQPMSWARTSRSGRGNANQWPGDAEADGIPTGSTPKANSVAISMAGGYGHTVERSIVLAYLPIEHAHEGAEIEVEILGDRRPATFVSQPLYDPDGQRLRG